MWTHRYGTTAQERLFQCHLWKYKLFLLFGYISGEALGGALSALRAQCNYGRLAEVGTHSLWYFGHHCLVVGFDALGMRHCWMFTLFHLYLFAHNFCSFPLTF